MEQERGVVLSQVSPTATCSRVGRKDARGPPARRASGSGLAMPLRLA
jgi:hypothetical protein